MIPFIFSMLINQTCHDFTLINKTKEWTDFDEKTLSKSHQICYTKFDKGCIVKFIKRETRTYWLICRRGNAN